jgi:anti-anti-sigma factor
MKIRRKDDGNVTVLELSGHFSGGADTYDDFERITQQLIDENRLYTVISFKHVNFVSSPGIGILMRNYAHYVRFGGEIVVCEVNTRVSIVFDLMIRKIFEAFETTREAVEVMKSRASDQPVKEIPAPAVS